MYTSFKNRTVYSSNAILITRESVATVTVTVFTYVRIQFIDPVC